MHISKLVQAAAVASLLVVAAAPATTSAAVFVGVAVDIAPPVIPVYVQPPCPAANFIWEPGYWAWGPGGYYWVPGTWVAAPAIGLLWTPGYWGWGTGAYYWHPGYWGRTVGYYGGINYGFGYFGAGYVGGRWYGNSFRYNTAITRVNRVVIHNTYIDRTVIRNSDDRRSYIGGRGGIQSNPTAEERAERDRGMAPTNEQQYHEQMSSQNRYHLWTVNHGQPNNGAVAHPYSQSNRPTHYAPVTNDDRRAAQQHVAPPNGRRPPR